MRTSDVSSVCYHNFEKQSWVNLMTSPRGRSRQLEVVANQVFKIEGWDSCVTFPDDTQMTGTDYTE
eukprot:scaffold24407_cov88-Skeletonema_dohrnii-CCMP3373.AAC.1